MKRVSALLAVAIPAAGLAACGTPGRHPQGEVPIRQGTIEQVTPVQIGTTHRQGVGAVVGGLAGLGVGSLIGSGTGRDVAMVLGSVGGALAGNGVQKRYDARAARPRPGTAGEPVSVDRCFRVSG